MGYGGVAVDSFSEEAIFPRVLVEMTREKWDGFIGFIFDEFSCPKEGAEVINGARRGSLVFHENLQETRSFHDILERGSSGKVIAANRCSVCKQQTGGNAPSHCS